MRIKTRETCFLYRKPQKLKTAKNVFRNFSSKNLFKILSFLSKSHSAEKRVTSYRRNKKLGVSFKMGSVESKLSFLRTSLRFYRALTVLEPQTYVVVEQFGAENISLLSGRFV